MTTGRICRRSINAPRLSTNRGNFNDHKEFRRDLCRRHCGDGPAGRHRRLCAKFRRPHLGPPSPSPRPRLRAADALRSPDRPRCPHVVHLARSGGVGPRYLQCFYGLDQVRFHRPTYLGDSVHAVSEVLSVRPRSDGETAIVTSKGSLVNQDGDLVFSGEFSFLVGETHSLDLEVGAR